VATSITREPLPLQHSLSTHIYSHQRPRVLKPRLYIVRCVAEDGRQWNMAKRWTDLKELRTALSKQRGLDEMPKLPRDHFFKSNSNSPSVVTERRLIFDQCLAYISANVAAKQPLVRSFLDLDTAEQLPVPEMPDATFGSPSASSGGISAHSSFTEAQILNPFDTPEAVPAPMHRLQPVGPVVPLERRRAPLEERNFDEPLEREACNRVPPCGEVEGTSRNPLEPPDGTGRGGEALSLAPEAGAAAISAAISTAGPAAVVARAGPAAVVARAGPAAVVVPLRPALSGKKPAAEPVVQAASEAPTSLPASPIRSPLGSRVPCVPDPEAWEETLPASSTTAAAASAAVAVAISSGGSSSQPEDWQHDTPAQSSSACAPGLTAGDTPRSAAKLGKECWCCSPQPQPHCSALLTPHRTRQVPGLGARPAWVGIEADGELWEAGNPNPNRTVMHC